MISLKEFKKLAKSEIVNTRYIVGGGVATEYPRGANQTNGDDYKHDDGCVGFSGIVPRGGTAEADPCPE